MGDSSPRWSAFVVGQGLPIVVVAVALAPSANDTVTRNANPGLKIPLVVSAAKIAQLPPSAMANDTLPFAALSSGPLGVLAAPRTQYGPPTTVSPTPPLFVSRRSIAVTVRAPEPAASPTVNVPSS